MTCAEKEQQTRMFEDYDLRREVAEEPDDLFELTGHEGPPTEEDFERGIMSYDDYQDALDPVSSVDLPRLEDFPLGHYRPGFIPCGLGSCETWSEVVSGRVLPVPWRGSGARNCQALRSMLRSRRYNFGSHEPRQLGDEDDVVVEGFCDSHLSVAIAGMLSPDCHDLADLSKLPVLRSRSIEGAEFNGVTHLPWHPPREGEVMALNCLFSPPAGVEGSDLVSICLRGEVGLNTSWEPGSSKFPSPGPLVWKELCDGVQKSLLLHVTTALALGGRRVVGGDPFDLRGKWSNVVRELDPQLFRYPEGSFGSSNDVVLVFTQRLLAVWKSWAQLDPDGKVALRFFSPCDVMTGDDRFLGNRG